MRIVSEETKKNIGWVIHEKRIEKQISQKELCKLAGITQTFMSLIEHGKRIPSYGVLEKIAVGLGEDYKTLEKEAGTFEEYGEIKLNHLLKKLMGNRSRKKIDRIIEFIETLS